MVVVIFGLDGACIDQFRSVNKRIKLYNFERLFQEGKISDLLSTYPYVTAPAWTTMFSGVNPGKHGVFDMYEIEGTQIKPSNMRNSDVPYLWDYLSWARKKVLSLGVPFIYPAPKINGVFVTGRFVPKLSSYPEGVENKFDLSGFTYRELPTEQDIESKIAQGARQVSEQIIDDLKVRMKTSLALMDSDVWDAIILVDNLPDEVLHMSYDDLDLVDKMLLSLDDFLGNLLRRLGPKDHMILVSDHGFSSVNDVLFMNEWLRSKNYLTFHESVFSKLLNILGLNWDRLSKPGFFSKLYGFSLKHLPGLVNFTKNQASSGFLLSDETKLTSSVSSFGINEPVAWIRLSKNSNYNTNSVYLQLDELKKQRLLKNVFKTQEIFYGKYVENALGQILVEANDLWAIDTSRLNGGRLVGKPLLTKKGIHKRAGIFGYLGPQTLRSQTPLRIHDIVPTVLELMSLPIPKNLDGSPLLTSSKIVNEAWKLDVSEGL